MDSMGDWEPLQRTQWSAGSPCSGLSGRLGARAVDSVVCGGDEVEDGPHQGALLLLGVPVCHPRVGDL